MKLTRPLTLAVAAASCALVLAACNPSPKAPDGADAAAKPDAAAKIPGLATEKEQVSYMIGMDIGKSLEPMKGEIDSATIKRAIDDMLNGKEPLLTQEQGMLIM